MFEVGDMFLHSFSVERFNWETFKKGYDKYSDFYIGVISDKKGPIYHFNWFKSFPFIAEKAVKNTKTIRDITDWLILRDAKLINKKINNFPNIEISELKFILDKNKICKKNKNV